MTTEPAPGDVLASRYRLDAFIGKGGMGVVWAATDLETERPVALKMLRWNTPSRPDLRRRLLREARAAMSVHHPNVVSVHAVFGTADDETPVVVMDLLKGETLGARLRRDEKLDVTETARILLPVVSAVAAAHARGLVHRDLKPDNIFLAESVEGGIVLDFGIAKVLAAEGEAFESGTLTGTGALLGTPCYMAPEQGFGEKDIDFRADVWALGVILYECLSGGRPVEGENLGQVLKRLLREGITPLRRVAPGIPADVAQLTERMLVTERERRLDDLSHVAEVLARWAKPSEGAHTVTIRTSRAPGRGWLLGPVAAVVAVVLVLSSRRGPSPEASRGGIAAAPLVPSAASAPPAVNSLPAPATPGTVVLPSRDLPTTANTAPSSNGTAPPPEFANGRRPVHAASDRSLHPPTGVRSSTPTATPSAATVLDGLASKPPF